MFAETGSRPLRYSTTHNVSWQSRAEPSSPRGIGRRASTSAAPAPTASPFDDDGSSEASSSDDDDESDDESDADAAATGAQGSASTAEARSRRDGRKLRPSPGELAYLESRMGPEVALMKAGKVPSCYVSTGGRVGSFWLRAPDPYFVLIEGAPEPEALERRDIFLWSPILLVEKLRCPFGCGGRLGVHCAWSDLAADRAEMRQLTSSANACARLRVGTRATFSTDLACGAMDAARRVDRGTRVSFCSFRLVFACLFPVRWLAHEGHQS